MLSFKRFLYIVLIVALLGGMFLFYNFMESQPAGAQLQSCLVPEREWIAEGRIDKGEAPRVWVLGESGEGPRGEIFSNALQLCRDLRLTVAGEGRLDAGKVTEEDLVIFCDPSVSRCADPAELEELIAGGGRVILAAGLSEEDGDSRLRPVLGIREMSPGENYHDLVFEKPLLPVQPEEAYYDGGSGSARLQVIDGASVYIRDADSGVPILYTHGWQEGSVCVINGTFLADVRCMGLLTGAMAALLPDFIYPVLGVKAVFLDGFPQVTPADDALCRRLYGYSAEGFVQDVVWPALQGVSLRTDTPYTSSILAAASSPERLAEAGEALFTATGKPVLQLGGELVYAASCPEDGEIVFNEELARRLSAAFPSYTVQGLVLEAGTFSPELMEVPGAEIRSVRGTLESPGTRLSWEEGRTVFPAATAGNSLEDGGLFAVCSVLGAYGMVSHVFHVGALIGRDGDAAWDLNKRQLGLFESEVLARAPWLEGRTLTQTEGDVRSYQNMDYGWTKSGRRVELTCGGAAKGQAFFYHTCGRIAGAEGLTYQEAGNGYYLLRIQEGRGRITLEEAN